MKVGFTGTRKGITGVQREELTKIFKNAPIDEFHHGMCKGADTDAHKLLREINPNIKIIGHPPINKKDYVASDCDEICEDKEYIERNHNIVDSTDFMIACPETLEELLRSGTWATIRYARNNKKFVSLLPPY